MGLMLIGDGAHHQHEDEHGGDPLQSRHENGSEETGFLCRFRRDQAQADAEYKTDKNLLDQRSLQKRHRKLEYTFHFFISAVG